MLFNFHEITPPTNGRIYYENLIHLRVIEGSNVEIPVPPTKDEIYTLMYDLIIYELYIHNLEFAEMNDESLHDFYIYYKCNYDPKTFIEILEHLEMKLGEESVVDEIYEDCNEKMFRNTLFVN